MKTKKLIKTLVAVSVFGICGSAAALTGESIGGHTVTVDEINLLELTSVDHSDSVTKQTITNPTEISFNTFTVSLSNNHNSGYKVEYSSDNGGLFVNKTIGINGTKLPYKISCTSWLDTAETEIFSESSVTATSLATVPKKLGSSTADGAATLTTSTCTLTATQADVSKLMAGTYEDDITMTMSNLN